MSCILYVDGATCTWLAHDHKFLDLLAIRKNLKPVRGFYGHAYNYQNTSLNSLLSVLASAYTLIVETYMHNCLAEEQAKHDLDARIYKDISEALETYKVPLVIVTKDAHSREKEIRRAESLGLPVVVYCAYTLTDNDDYTLTNDNGEGITYRRLDQLPTRKPAVVGKYKERRRFRQSA